LFIYLFLLLQSYARKNSACKNSLSLQSTQSINTDILRKSFEEKCLSKTGRLRLSDSTSPNLKLRASIASFSLSINLYHTKTIHLQK